MAGPGAVLQSIAIMRARCELCSDSRSCCFCLRYRRFFCLLPCLTLLQRQVVMMTFGANRSVLRCFLRSSLTEVPSFHRSYPVSQVLRTPPPPHTARSISHELPVNPDRDHRWGFPCCVWSPLPSRVEDWRQAP